MAKLKNPPNNLAAIRQDYRDKHTSGSALFAGRKYDRQIKNKDGKLITNKDGSPKMWRPYIQLRRLITNEDILVQESHWYSEQCQNDCYCSINSFPADCAARTAENVACLTGFYLDLDHRAIHNIARQQQAPELVASALGYADQIVATLADYLPGNYGMPVITYTGGGYGFYFRLRPIAATEQNRAKYKDVHELLYQRFNLLFAALLEEEFENDHSVVGDIARVIHITGTYNSKTGAFAQYIARYGNAETNTVYEYKLDEIVALYHLDNLPKVTKNARLVKDSPLQIKEKEREEKKEQQRSTQPAQEPPAYAKRGSIAYPTKWYQGYANSKQLAKYLELAVKSLEYQDSHGDLQRNNALFLAACFKTEIEYAKYGYYIFGNVCGEIQLNIFNYLQDLNGNLAKPLAEEELKNLVKSALSNQYHFRRLDTIQRFLNLSDAEFDALGWLDKQKAEQAKQERNNALTDLDKDVIKLYLSGLSDAKIAERVGITKRTSINIRQRLGVTNRSVKWEDIDFDGNKRHVKPEAKATAPAPMPIFPDMPWYKPTPKAMYVRDYRTNSTLVKNAVVERAQALAGCNEGFDNLIDFQMRLSVLRAQVAQMSEAEKREILAAICADA